MVLENSQRQRLVASPLFLRPLTVSSQSSKGLARTDGTSKKFWEASATKVPPRRCAGAISVGSYFELSSDSYLHRMDKQFCPTFVFPIVLKSLITPYCKILPNVNCFCNIYAAFIRLARSAQYLICRMLFATAHLYCNHRVPTCQSPHLDLLIN